MIPKKISPPLAGGGRLVLLSTPTVRRHSLSTDLGVIVTALDGGALALPHQGGGSRPGKFQIVLVRILEGRFFEMKVRVLLKSVGHP